MDKVNSLIGTKFNMWTVIDIIDNKNCLCRCECGNESVVTLYNLINNRSKSCGCTKKKKNDLSGQSFGDWTVLKMLPNRKCLCKCICGEEKEQYYSNLLNAKTEYKCRHKGEVGKKFGSWTVLQELGGGKILCKCNCGTTKELYKKAVINGQTKSCGCKAKEYERETRGYSDLTGMKFGEWTVLSFAGNSGWLCECSCENKTKRIVYKEALVDGRSKSCGCKQGEHIKETISTLYNGVYPQNVNYESELQNKVAEYIKSFYTDEVITSCRDIITPLELDIYLPKKKIAIEINGNHWHSEQFKDKYYHRDKSMACNEKGVRLIHLFEHEIYNNESNIKYYIHDAIQTDNIVYARNTKASFVDNSKAKEFLNKYHIQGYARSEYNVALIDKNEIIGIMTFGSPRFDKNCQYELIRLCFKANTAVVGGAEKMFSTFTKYYKPSSILSYCDIAKFDGKVYDKLGFKLSGVSEPGYIWVKGRTVKNRYEAQKNKLVEQGFGTLDQTEDEIMHSLGFNKMFNCGNYKFMWTK